jgi:CBS domain-containing protein
MHVREGMSTLVLTVGPGHTLRQAAAAMAENPDTEKVADHLTAELVFASPEWSLEQAAVAMVRGGFRHLVVVKDGETAGILSVRDIVRCWTDDGASCELPQQPGLARAS